MSLKREPEPGTSYGATPALKKEEPGTLAPKKEEPAPGTSRDPTPPYTVPKSTQWRRRVYGGLNIPHRHRLCSLCKKRMVRETGHSVHKKTRQTFCQSTDPFGRSVEQWLTEVRGGVFTKDLYEANLERWGRYKYRPDARERYNQKRREKRAHEREQQRQKEEVERKKEKKKNKN